MNTEITRIILLIGLFVTGYLLVQQWNQDFNIPAQPASSEGAPSPQALDSLPSTPSPQPAAPGADTPGIAPSEEEIPSVAPASTRSAAQPEEVHESDFILIESDTLRLWLNPQGGDLYRADLKRYPLTLDEPEAPITLLTQESSRIYIAQSGLIGPHGPDASRREGLPPRYTSASASWVMAESQEVLEVPLFHTDAQGNEYVKTLRLHRGSHLLEIEYEVQNRMTETWQGNFYGQFKRDDKSPPNTSSGFGPGPYVGAALTTPDSRYEKLKFGDIAEQPYNLETQGGWIAVLQHYFLAAWIPGEGDLNSYSGRRSADGNYFFGYVAPRFTVSPGASGGYTTQLYIGPKTQSVLEEIAPNLDLTVDYGFLWWLSQPLFFVLAFIEGFVGNWGVAIILLTFLIKLVLYPLSEMAYRSMANMRRVGPKIKQLQERHAGDRQALSREMMNFYRKEKINPLGGCFPMLLQMPVFLALYWVLFESVELRHAPFIFWIDDLTAIDEYFILPIIMGLSMFLQQQLNPPIPDPMQARIMKMLPIIFTVFFAFFPSGLVLYWAVNNILSMTQQWVVNRRVSTRSSSG